MKHFVDFCMVWAGIIIVWAAILSIYASIVQCRHMYEIKHLPCHGEGGHDCNSCSSREACADI
jgi:hypothetical protein